MRLPKQPDKKESASLLAKQEALRRVNRLLMRKRRHARFYQDGAPRLFLGLLIVILTLISLFSGTAGGAYAYYQAQLPLLRGIANHSLFQTTHIYDRNGHLLYELYDQQIGKGRRTYVNYNDISPFLVNATVAAEDHTFWQNSGVDFQGILRAAFSNIQSQGVVEGGSTVTQQLIKKQFFDNQPRTVQIKAEEAILAYGLTQQYPKWKIMEMYLNTVYYGALNYGVEAAAQNYFNLQPKCTQRTCKPGVSQLDLAQASLLAGLPQSPSRYDPTQNKPVALARQKVVLQSMVDLHMITRQQGLDAEAESAKFTFKSYSETHHIQAPHFVRYVIDQVLVPLFGANNVLDGGYNIYTTLDMGLEKKVEQIAYNHLYKAEYDPYLRSYGPLSRVNNVNNAAVLV
ncbi:MAG: transglycosylase domain-containing protein, partial [Ktedonobacteraceae bacterium]|nr:transglycosylase domain-containing protein [Ktedonobacteraceae bacterium]